MGFAYLPDGSRIDYKDYLKHPRWKKVRETRLEFDDFKCAICHRDMRGEPYETHHLSYALLGRERLRDVITLCPSCHAAFHQNWQRLEFWKGKESGHWQVYDLQHTAQICARYWKEDRMISRDPAGINLCNADVAAQIVDDYFRAEELTSNPIIDPHDINLFVRNKRYELFFEAEKRGLTVEQFLDEYFGEKVRGKNPLRTEAGRKNGPFDHTPKSFHLHYAENKNINILMEEVRKIENNNQEGA